MGSRLEKNSTNVRKRIESHTFNNEEGEEYEASKFGGFSDYMRRKKIKLQNLDAQLRSQTTDKPQIFRGIVAQVNGYTQPSLSDLHHLIVSHGGGFLQYLDGKTAVTHIIASQLTPKKKAEFARYRIVKPAWVVDSVKAGRVLPWENYRVVDEGVGQKVLGFDNGHVVSQANKQRQSYRGQTDTSWYTSQVRDIAQELDGTYEQAEEQFQDWAVEADEKTVSGPEGEEHVLEHEDENLKIPDNTVHEKRKSANLLTHADESDEDSNEQYEGENRDSEAGPSGENNAGMIVRSVSPLPTSAVKSNEKRTLTAEEHNAILLQNPHMAKSSTANPDFLNQYYRESRLHHLSAWKAELKAQLQARAMEKSSSQKARQKRPPGARRYIMHVDFDSFFVAVGLRKNPDLVDVPVVVAHGSGPGSEIASCNYPARKFGVKNGMWMKTALELCADLKVLPYDFKAYEEASRHFYDTILEIDGIVQSISIDEALVDVSLQCIQAGGSDGKSTSEGAIYREQEKANEIAGKLRTVVKQKTGCEVSVGIGGNILLAKVALRKAKPAGQHLIKPEDIIDFIGELTVTDLPGVAHSLSNKLEEIGVKLVKDIRSLTKERLVTHLGPKTGEKLWDYSRGIDKVEVGDQVIRKSVSAEVNWGIRFITQQQAEEFVQSLCDELHKRLLENAVKGKQLTMKIMRKAADAGMDPPKNLGHGKCDTFNKSVVLGVATNDKGVIGKEAISILRGYGFSPGELRGLGVQMQKLEPIKSTSTVTPLLDGSQRRLQFKKPDVMASTKVTSPSLPSPPAAKTTDMIEEVPTPEKPKAAASIAGAVYQGKEQGIKPLNIIGTQFMLPTQVDPSVLAELPSDIRSKLAPKQKSIASSIIRPSSPLLDTKSRSASPYISDREYSLPNQSQLDPETLAALPEDVRDELMAHYREASKLGGAHHGQSLLPQSPRKARPTAPSKKVMLTPTKKQKTSTFLGRGRPKTKTSSTSTLTQSNFVSLPRGNTSACEPVPVANQEVSQSFLAELPEEIRLEVLAEQKRNRMKLKSGLNVGATRRKLKSESAKADLVRGQQRLHIPAHPDIPTFTSKRLSSLTDLRNAMSAWVQEFSGEGETGPFEEDAFALGQYLSRVVLEEKDMAKAAAVVEWLSYLVSDWPFETDDIRFAWQNTVKSLKDTVQESVQIRGLAPIDFEIV